MFRGFGVLTARALAAVAPVGVRIAGVIAAKLITVSRAARRTHSSSTMG